MNQIVNKPNFLVKRSCDEFIGLSITSIYYTRSPWTLKCESPFEMKNLYSNLHNSSIK